MVVETTSNPSDLVVAGIVVILGVCVFMGLALVLRLTSPPPPMHEAKTLQESEPVWKRMSSLLWVYKCANNKFLLDPGIVAVFVYAYFGCLPHYNIDTLRYCGDTAKLIDAFLLDTENGWFELSDSERHLFERVRDFYLSPDVTKTPTRKALLKEISIANRYADGGDYSAYLHAKDLRKKLNDPTTYR